MAISSFPFDNQDSTEGQYTTLFRELQQTGVADTYGGTAWKIVAASGMNVTAQPGFALVRGHGAQNTAVEPIAIPAASSAPVYHRVVLRLDPAANSILPVVISGTAGGPVPSLNQTDIGIFEMPVATILISPGDVNVNPAKITDDRLFLGSTVGPWSTATRPSSPRYGRLGYNTTIGQWEFWNGSAWATIVPADVFARLSTLENQPYIMRSEAWRVGVAGGISIPDDVWQILDWRMDNGGQSGIGYTFESARFSFPTAGRYVYDVTLTFNSNTTGARELRLARVDGSPNGDYIDYDSRDAAKIGWTTVRLNGEVRLAANDQVILACRQTSTGNLNLISGHEYQRISFRRVGS
ncbi:hypothetical protein [Kribbella italica]|uniref:Minor tail protein n=1 Tax=Kribbella italica TaxID=1540520 RepID=A0A7W9J0J8_9ACTN|nr:hypothetical protein [Kribbella italica]MBB5833406.1 hypothetical protein [Kribbella italica]